MTRVFLLVSAVMLLSAAADAATPPQYQRPKEMRAILDDAKVLGAFDVAHPIDGIERVEPAQISRPLRNLRHGCHADR